MPSIKNCADDRCGLAAEGAGDGIVIAANRLAK